MFRAFPYFFAQKNRRNKKEDFQFTLSVENPLFCVNDFHPHLRLCFYTSEIHWSYQIKGKGCGSPFQGYRRKEGKRCSIDEIRSCTAPADTPDVRESGNRGAYPKKPENPAYGRSSHKPIGAGKMQAVLYTFADKFLDKNKLDKVRKMTLLGEMLVNDGIVLY